MKIHLFLPALLATTLQSAPWMDLTTEAGLGGHSVARLKFADLNGDYRPDVVLLPESKSGEPPLVFLNKSTGEGSQKTPRFEPLQAHGLPALQTGDVIAFADINNDGQADAILGRYLDIYQEDYAPPPSTPHRSSWFPGNGDGTFGETRVFADASMATTRAIAVGDVNQDGHPDILFGNWYERYFSGYEGFPNDLLLQHPNKEGEPTFTRWPLPQQTVPTDYHDDLGGRPTYGAALAKLHDGLPMMIELNYGRRWNRLYHMQMRQPLKDINWRDEPPSPLQLNDPRAMGDHLIRQLRGKNIAAEAGVDGDAIRHGRHPKWPHAHSTARPRSTRPDEPPFRANGNTFDVGIGDIDNDGDFDLFLSTIIHAWAGESSDRSRFLVNQLKETGKLEFYSFERLSVDRIPDLPEPGEPLEPVHTQFNQGDIYAELADLNHDGRLDLVLCSSDYPDPPPHDERLRIYFQQEDGRFLDVTKFLGIDHIGAGMPSLADVDGDGDLDLLVGQSFNRLPAELRRKASIASGALDDNSPSDAKPERRARLFINKSPGERKSLILHIQGNPTAGVTQSAFGAIVRVTADLDDDPETPPVTQSRQVLGPAGHAGKQNTFAIHVGLRDAEVIQEIKVEWPNRKEDQSSFLQVEPGKYFLQYGSSELEKLAP